MENRAHALAAGFFVLLLGLCVVFALWWFAGKREASREILLVTQGNVTGLAYVELEDSGKSEELLPPDADPLPRIALKQTLFESLAERATVIAGQITVLAANLNRLLDERGHLNHTLENLDSASSALKDLPEVMAGIRRVLSPANMKHLESILARLEQTAGEAAPLTVEMRALVAQLSGVSRHFDQLMADTGGEISATTLPRVNALVEDLDRNSRQLGRLIENLNEAPQSLIFGRPPAHAGPGEAGFVAPGR